MENRLAEWVEAPEMAPGNLGVWGLIGLCPFRRHPKDSFARLLLFPASSRKFACTQAALVDRNPSPLRVPPWIR